MFLTYRLLFLSVSPPPTYDVNDARTYDTPHTTHVVCQKPLMFKPPFSIVCDVCGSVLQPIADSHYGGDLVRARADSDVNRLCAEWEDVWR